MQPIKITQNDAERIGVYLPNLSNLDAYCKKLIDDKLHPYVALRVWKKNELVFSGDYGTHSPGGEPLRTDAIYPLQSISKAVTATCAAILQEQGKINFFDRVKDRFPEFDGENKERVLLWHLLSHTSGMDEDAIDKRLNERWAAIESAAATAGLDDETKQKLENAFWNDSDGLSDILKMPLTYLPGTQFSYWNFGYHIIKVLIERVSGMTLEAFAKKHIFDPLGMNDTYWFLPEEKRDRFATCDPKFKGGEWINGEGMMTSDSASGGIKSTMDDIARFGRMYLNMGTLDGVRIISPATVRLLTRNHNAGLPDSFWLGRHLSANWGLGWDVKENKIDDLGMLHSPNSYNHGGYGGARILIDPDYDLVVSIYIREQREESFYDNMNYAMDILYSALN
jgi:CubicO group peptidase (beta-lactamase class C family)